ncbi:MAG TPA: hypothetical protein VFD82_02640 [Planctomycetota bacterium]|nr:hypothetical protein [Planctomycetota bacterium]
MLRLFFAFLLGATGVASCQAPGRAPAGDVDARQIHWQRSLADAKALAAATGRPLLLALNMDGESASDRIVHEQYRDPAFVALTRKCVCLGASVFRHNARDHDDQGRRICCPRFPGITCGDHIALEPVIFDAYLADGDRVAPRHALVMPDGKKAFDMSLNFDLKDIDRALAAAVANVPEPAAGAAADDWNTLAARRDCHGREALEAAVANARDDATIGEALAAIGGYGDAGSLDALRPLFARAASLPERMQGEMIAAGTHLPDGAFQVLRDQVQGLGAAIDDPGPDALQTALGALLQQVRKPGAQRSFFAARAAVDHLLAGSNPVDLRTLLHAAGVVTRRDATLPRTGGPTDEMPAQGELESLLAVLDKDDAARRANPEWQARFAKASLDLGRVRLQENHKGVALLFDDAARYFERATSAPDAKYEWWIERARCAYFRQRYTEQAECGARAFALATGSDTVPREQDLLGSPVLGDARAIEAMRWLGDAHARLLGERAGGPNGAELRGMIDALRALGIVAASPFGSDGDWQTFAGLCGTLGLLREQVAVAYAGALRYPASRELRAALNAALWQSGRPELMPVAAEAIERAVTPSAEAAWFAGYAWILAAEDLRRRDDSHAAIAAYWSAHDWFQKTAARDDKYADDSKYYQAVARVGQGMAHASAGEQGAAATDLVQAIGTRRDLSQLRDGLGCDAQDLVDRIVEWTARGASDITPSQLMAWLDASGDPFWANALSDAALREALRADGRNPQRVEQETIDASGKKITMPMGLPTAPGDDYLRQAIEAGRRAAARAKDDADKVPLAQALTIAAERQLVRGKTDIAAFVTEAAPLVGLEPPAAGADETALRALVTELRKKLGEARPRFRPGR